MKKVLTILMVLIALSMVGVGLYNTLANLDAVDEELSECASMNPFPYEMPDVVMDPAFVTRCFKIT